MPQNNNIISSNPSQNQFQNIPTNEFSSDVVKCRSESTKSILQFVTQNHPRCPKRELPKNSIQLVNHGVKTISIAFPQWEISFVGSRLYFQVFMCFWTQNDLFLRCEYIAIVQRIVSIFAKCFVAKQYLFANRLCSLSGR